MNTSVVKTDPAEDVPYFFDFLFTPYFTGPMTIQTLKVCKVPETIVGRGFVRVFKVKACVVVGLTKDGLLELRLKLSYATLLKVGDTLNVRYQKGRYSGLLKGKLLPGNIKRLTCVWAVFLNSFIS